MKNEEHDENEVKITPNTSTSFPIKTAISIALTLIVFGGWVSLKTNKIDSTADEVDKKADLERVQRLEVQVEKLATSQNALQEIVTKGAVDRNTILMKITSTNEKMMIMMANLQKDIDRISAGDLSVHEETSTTKYRSVGSEKPTSLLNKEPVAKGI